VLLQSTAVLTTTNVSHTQPAATSVVLTTTYVVHALQAGVGVVPVRWKAPAQGHMKYNIDAAFSELRNRTGISICLRDEGGVFVLAKTISFVGVYSVDIGEALGLYHTLQWMSDMQLDNIDFEVDSESTRDAIYSGREDISELGNIITGSWSLLSSKFNNSRVEFGRRQANVVAHTLAGETTFLASPIVYFHIPFCVETLIINEML